MSWAPFRYTTLPSRDRVTRIDDGFDIDVFPQPYHMHATPAPRRRRPCLADALKASASLRSARQCGRSASRHATESDAGFQHLARRGPIADPQRVAVPELQWIDSHRDGQLVHQGLVGDCGLGHPEAPEGAGRRGVRENCPRIRAHVRHPVRTHAVHRHPTGDGGPPRGVRAGVEVGVALVSEQAAIRLRDRPGADARRMPLGRGGHRFRSGIRASYRRPEHPCSHRNQGLDGLIELSAETAAAGRGADSDTPGRDPEHVRDLVPVHVGRLRAGRHLDAAAVDGSRVAGLRLDVRMLDEGGREFAARFDQPFAAGRRHVPSMHAAAREHVVRVRGLDGGGPPAPPLRADRRAPATASRRWGLHRRSAAPACPHRQRAPRPPRRGSARCRGRAPAGP